MSARAHIWLLAAILAAASLSAGCSIFASKKPVTHPFEYVIDTPYDGVRTIAVAPTINLSGSRDFDPLVVSDTLFAEMQQVRGLNMLPLNKTLLAMQKLHIRSIDDVPTAQRLAEAMGADAIVIPAVTAYDPYRPPVVGMVLQLYTPRTTTIVKSEPLGANVASRAAPQDMGQTTSQPVSQVAAVFNASNQSVIKEMATFAGGRIDYDSAYQDQRFMIDTDAYMRFVCHAMARRLLELERIRVSDR